MELEKLEIAHSLLQGLGEADLDTTDTINKWKRLGDVALAKGNLPLAYECANAAGDFSGLLLLYTSLGNADGMVELAARAKAAGKTNVAFMALFLLNRVEECINLLIETDRIPEAAFMARTYLPSHMGRIVHLWRADLSKVCPSLMLGLIRSHLFSGVRESC